MRHFACISSTPIKNRPQIFHSRIPAAPSHYMQMRLNYIIFILYEPAITQVPIYVRLNAMETRTKRGSGASLNAH
jgi:hypothetical protein